jgi:hypothetical protein
MSDENQNEQPSEEFNSEFERFEQQRELATAMTQFKVIFDSATAAGFTEAQALKLISHMLIGGTK